MELVRVERLDGAARSPADGVFDLIFLCLAALPDGNPVLVAAVRRAAPKTPVAVLAPDGSPASARRAIAAGASGYLPAGSAPATVRHALEVMLSGGIYLPDPAAGGPHPGARVAGASGESECEPAALRLGRRPAAVLRLMVEGRSEREIAAALGLTPAVVGLHRATLLAGLERIEGPEDPGPLAAPQLIEDARGRLAEARDAGSDRTPAADLLDGLLNAIPAPLIVTKAAGPAGFPHIVYVNERFCDFYAYPKAALVNGTTELITGPETSLPRLRAMRRQVGDRIVRMPITAYDGRRQPRPVRIDVARFPDGPAAGPGALWLALHIPLPDPTAAYGAEDW